MNSQDKSGKATESNFSGKFGITATSKDSSSAGLNAEANFTDKNTTNSESQIQESFSQIFLQVFQITDIILEIKEILKTLKIKNIVILLDDFSEISDDAIRTFVNVILAPLNNWSEEFIKFKIAAYPNRIFYGKIDPGKVDTVNLDFYNLYSEFERDRMEEGATDFTRRLVHKRIQYFTGLEPENYFDTSRTSINDYYELLFKASMNVPRIMGYILSFCFESRTIYDKLITKSDIDAASQRYYEEKIEPFFYKTTYSLQSLDEKVGTLQLKGLLEKIITRESETKKRIVSGDLKGEAYNIPTPYSSHFYFDTGLEKYLKTLELNYFLSKYTEMTDKDGRLASIYCINYGLAQKHNIVWGKTSHRKYFIERPFNFNQLIREFLNTSKNIHCTNTACNQKFTQDQTPMLEFNNFKCNRCGSTVIIENIADSIYDEILAIPQEKLLPKQELEIVHELSKSEDSLFAREIAEELDISSYSVASKARILDEKKGLVKREKDKSGLLTYRLSDKGNGEYNF